MAAVHTCYISSGCNRVPHGADWGRNDLICFGSCNDIAIYSPDGVPGRAVGTVCMLMGHTDRVNCARWIPPPRHTDYLERELISCSVDKTVIVWRIDNGEYKKMALLVGHTESVVVTTAIYIGTNTELFAQKCETVIATASSDSTVRLWKRIPDSDDVSEFQVLTFGSGFVLDLSLMLIPNTQVPLLACAADDHKVHLYVRCNDQFEEAICLAGHEDWVRGVAMTVDDNEDILLASCAQDQLIRIWRLSQRFTDTGSVSRSVRDLHPEEDIKMKENTFSFLLSDGKKSYYAVCLESVLCGHESWIYSVHWQPPKQTAGKWSQPMRLLSASMDKTMIVWSPEKDSGLWVENVRVGEVGGNTLGFYGGLFSASGESILAHGYQGALHQWRHNKELNSWEPAVTGGGHFESVQDLDWGRGGGNFVLSTSVDQTTRLHSPWIQDGKYIGWYEIGRPQVHGYDMQCLTMLKRYMFASAGDEKVTRVFQAPRSFIQNLCSICNLDLNQELGKEDVSALPEGAIVPALGLSNKAVFEGLTTTVQDDRLIQPNPNQQYPEVSFSSISLTVPPNEEHLLQNTLWPEVHKLYGHGYEVFALACNPEGSLLASSCKASRLEHANILLWDTSSWRKVASLDGCTLTVTQMAFSPSGQYLLAVSRDRTWSLYNCTDGQFSRISYVDRKTTPHSRIIWACAWTPGDHYFFTASRDNKVIVWSLKEVCQQQPPRPVSTLEMKDSVTAIDVAPFTLSSHRYLIATGLDKGDISLHLWTLDKTGGDSMWTHLNLDRNQGHQQTVKRLRFRPTLGLAGFHLPENESNHWQQLASCGADHCVKIHNIDLNCI